MYKRWALLLGLLAVCGLVACKSAATPTLEPEPAAQPKATATEVKAQATATVAQKSAPTATPAAVSKPGATPTPSWQIPEVREGEWTKGPEDAGLVLVEYSEFQ